LGKTRLREKMNRGIASLRGKKRGKTRVTVTGASLGEWRESQSKMQRGEKHNFAQRDKPVGKGRVNW